MTTITSQQIQAYAAQQMAGMRRRGAVHLQQARDRAGDARNEQRARFIDSLATEAAEAGRVLAGVCELAGDAEGAKAILADRNGTVDALISQAAECRMASLHTWLAGSAEQVRQVSA